jgi:hypothetical protein
VHLFVKGVFTEKLVAVMRRVRPAHHFGKNPFNESPVARRLLIFICIPPRHRALRCAGKRGAERRKTSRLINAQQAADCGPGRGYDMLHIEVNQK